MIFVGEGRKEGTFLSAQADAFARANGTSNESSASDKEKVLRSPAPSTDGFRAYQSWSLALGCVAHVERIAIGKVRGDIAIIADRNIGALFSKLDSIAVVFEAMRKQTGSAIFAPRHCSNQHGSPPKEVTSRLFYKRQGGARKWQVCGKMCIVLCGCFSGDSTFFQLSRSHVAAKKACARLSR